MCVCGVGFASVLGQGIQVQFLSVSVLRGPLPRRLWARLPALSAWRLLDVPGHVAPFPSSELAMENHLRGAESPYTLNLPDSSRDRGTQAQLESHLPTLGAQAQRWLELRRVSEQEGKAGV